MAKKRRAWKPETVRVLWIDACSRTDVHGTLGAVLDQAKLVTRESVGYLLRYDDSVTVLARDYDPPESPEDDAEVGDIVVIPSGWVLAVLNGRKRMVKTPAPPQDALQKSLEAPGVENTSSPNT